MHLKLLGSPLAHNRCIAPRLCEIQHHGFPQQIETVYLLDGARGGFDVVKHNKRLPFRLQVLLGDDVDDLAIFGEDRAERLLQLVDLDSFFEVADLCKQKYAR